MPKFIGPLVMACVALAAIVLLVPPLLSKKDSGSSLEKTISNSAATTAPDAPAEDPAKAAAEAEAAAAAEKAANGKDTGAATVTTKPAGGETTKSADSSGTAAAVTTTPPGDTTESTSPNAAPVTVASTTTTAAPGATTTAPTTTNMYYYWKQEGAGAGFAHWHNVGAGGAVGQTFKATQPLLTEVGLNLAGSSVTINIRKGGPGGAVLGSSTAVPINSYAETRFVFPRPIALSVGGIYYLEGVAQGGQMYSWYSNTNDYADGDGFLGSTAQGHDMNARIIGRSS